jgi:hypothetical protein
LDIVVFPAASANRHALARAVKKSGATQIASEGPCIICKARNPEILAGIPGIDWVAAARKVTRKFSDVTGAIVQAGSRVILPGEKFYVRVIQTARADYVERDVEFASAGALVEKLAEISALPARNEYEAGRVVVAVIGKKSAHVCVKGKT